MPPKKTPAPALPPGDVPRDKKLKATETMVTVPVAHRDVPVAQEPATLPMKPNLPIPLPQASSMPEAPRFDAGVDTLKTIRAVIAYVQHYLRARLKDDPIFAAFPDIPLHQHSPLEIKAASSEQELLSYKAPWQRTLAVVAFKSTGMYEASANLFWANPFPASDEETILAGDAPSWGNVNEMAELFRMPETAKPGRLALDHRILFPVTLCAHASTLDDFGAETFPGTLRIVTGHAVIYAWYLAMCEALDSPRKEWVASLWQAALTMGLQGVIAKNPEALAVVSMQRHSDMQHTARNLTDSFPAFARKVEIAVRGVTGTAKRLEHCLQHGVRFNGALMHRMLLLAASTYVERVDRETHAMLLALEHKYGRELLTGKYNNLNRVLQLCNQEVDKVPKMWNCTCSELLQHVLHYIEWVLDHHNVQPTNITVEWLDKARDGTIGCVHKVLAKVQLVHHCRSLVRDAPPESKTREELLKVLDCFNSYRTYIAAFDASTLEQTERTEPQGDNVEDPLVALRALYCKTGQNLLDFLFDVFAGDFDKDIGELLRKHSGMIGLLVWTELDGEAGKRLRDVSRQLGIHKHTVSVMGGGAPPPASGRALQRALSNGGCDDGDTDASRAKEVEHERQEVWRQAQAARRRYAAVGVAKYKSAAELQRWLEKQTAAHEYAGKAGEAHRIFVFSADTYGSEGSEPWVKTNPTKDLDVVLKFMTSQTGPADVLLSFDGRNLANRKAMTPIMEQARHLSELWVVYDPTKRLGRRVAWASDSRETAWISLPVPRTAIPTKERSNLPAKWADSTHASFYSGVPQAPWESLPLISEADKEKVLGDAPAKPTAKIFDTERGMPLYWAERKPVLFWEDILFCLDGHMVIDLSPGSGSAGRACLRLGMQYVAACRTEAHASWLANVLDREACELVTTTQSPLFEQTLANLVKTHFADVLEYVREQRAAKDVAPEDE